MKNLKFNFVLLALLLFGVKALHAQTNFSSFSSPPPEFTMTITQSSDPASPWLAELECVVEIVGNHPNWEFARMEDSWGANLQDCQGSCTFTWSYPRATKKFPMKITCVGLGEDTYPVVLDQCIVVIEPCVGCDNQ